MNVRLLLPSMIVAAAQPAWAGPYPALPVSSSTAVTPNVMLVIDNSGSMKEDENNKSLTNGDSDPKSKMAIAKRVATSLIDGNRHLRWGVFAFDEGKNDRSGVLKADVQDATVTANRDRLANAINGLSAKTWTPLGETMLEVAQYFKGGASLYGKRSGNYTSPIQYRCQKNFAIVVTDGLATQDAEVPNISYRTYDANGAFVNNTFSACAQSGPSCPLVLEGTAATTPGYIETSDGKIVNRPRLLRDASKYANEADLVTTGLDLDKKDFNDPQFRSQNLITYTVGFSVNNPVLSAASVVGKGRYFRANNESELKASLDSAIADINNRLSNAAGVSVSAEYAVDGNRIYQPVYDPKDWSGSLKCKIIDRNGNVQSSCQVPEAVFPAPNNRNVLTKSTQGIGPFLKAGRLDGWQQAALDGNKTTTAIEKVIDYLRGAEISDFRKRKTPLGDMVGSQPLFVGKPSDGTSDKDYPEYQLKNTKRSLVFIGANDGMLHAFDGEKMSEVMAYVPEAVFPNLKTLTQSDYGAQGGTLNPHVWHVNGPSTSADVKLDNKWTTLIATSLGQGGQAIVVSETSDGQVATPRWEYNDRINSRLGYNFGTPLIYNIRTGTKTVTPALIVSNGYKSGAADDYKDSQFRELADSSVLLVLDARTGALLKEIVVPLGTGLSAPAGVDVNQDGILDYVYAGDLQGRMWRFDLTSKSYADFKVDPNPLFDAGVSQPIVKSPAIRQVNDKNGNHIGNLVLFGSGKLLENSDKSDNSRQALYGVLDRIGKPVVTVKKGELVQQSVVETKALQAGEKPAAGRYRKLTDNAVDYEGDPVKAVPAQSGWMLELPDTGERLMAMPVLLADRVLFASGAPITTEKCITTGLGWLTGLNPLSGGPVKDRSGKRAFSYVDLNEDRRSTSEDQVPFVSGSAYASAIGLDGLPAELTYVQKTKNVQLTIPDPEVGDIGNTVALKDVNQSRVFGTTKTALPANASGNLLVPLLGSETILNKNLPPAPAIGATVQTTTWWEVLQ